LRDAEGSRHLVGRDALLGRGEHPDGGEPLVEADRGVLEDRADLHGELLPTARAAPYATVAVEAHLVRTAPFAGTGDAIRPTHSRDELTANDRIREVPDGLNQCFGEAFVCHEHRLR